VILKELKEKISQIAFYLIKKYYSKTDSVLLYKTTQFKLKRLKRTYNFYFQKKFPLKRLSEIELKITINCNKKHSIKGKDEFLEIFLKYLYEALQRWQTLLDYIYNLEAETHINSYLFNKLLELDFKRKRELKKYPLFKDIGNVWKFETKQTTAELKDIYSICNELIAITQNITGVKAKIPSFDSKIYAETLVYQNFLNYQMLMGSFLTFCEYWTDFPTKFGEINWCWTSKVINIKTPSELEEYLKKMRCKKIWRFLTTCLASVEILKQILKLRKAEIC